MQRAYRGLNNVLNMPGAVEAHQTPVAITGVEALSAIMIMYPRARELALSDELACRVIPRAHVHFLAST